MVKKMLVAVFCIAVAGITGMALAADWPEPLMKELEALKKAGHDKQDMPASIEGIKEITGDELKKWIDSKKAFVLMDNRLKADYDKEHIVGAVLLTVDELVKDPKLAEPYKKDDILVNYCNGVKCWRSPGAILLLKQMGYKNIYWYRVGIPDWIKKDYPTVEAKK